MKVTIFWLEKSKKKYIRDNICEHFHQESKMTINGETFLDLNEEQILELKDLEGKGYLRIRNKLKN